MRNFKANGLILAALGIGLLVTGCARLSRGEACALAEREIRVRENLPTDCQIVTHGVHHWGRWVVTARIDAAGRVPLVEPRRVVTITDDGRVHDYGSGPITEHE